MRDDVPDVAGIQVTSAAEVARLVERQLHGRGGWSDPSDYTPVDGLVRALHASGDLAPAFARALVDLLDHGDDAIRAGAACALTEVTEHVSADEIVRVLDAHPQRFRGVLPPPGYPAADEDLESRLLIAVARSVRSSDVRARHFLELRARRDQSVSALLGLARTDPQWVAANADRVVPRNAIGGILRAVPGRAQRRAIVSALAPWPAGERDGLLESKAWKLLPLDDDEKAELAVLISGDTEQA
jgi:hypothetical protein